MVSLSSHRLSWSLGEPFSLGSHGLIVSRSPGFWWLSWSPGLLTVSPGLLVAHSPLGSHDLIVSRSHGLLVGLMVSWSSHRFSWSLCGPFLSGLLWSHRLAAHFPLGSHVLIVSRSHGLLVALMVSSSGGRGYT